MGKEHTISGQVPRLRGDPFPLTGQVVGDRVVIRYPWILQDARADTLAPGNSDVSLCPA